MIRIQKLAFNLFQVNTYIVWDESNACAIIDPGCQTDREKETLHAFIKEKGLKPEKILLTHGHMDHVYGVADCCSRYGIKAYMHANEAETLSGFNPSMLSMGLPPVPAFEYTPVEDGEQLTFGGTSVRVLATPGHSMGGVCYWLEKQNVLFSGDTLFAGSIGRTDNRWASLDLLKKSLKETLMALDGEIDVFPGHGPATSIGNERLMNPFVTEEFGDLGYEA